MEFVNLSGQNGKSPCKKPEIKWTVAGVYVFERQQDMAQEHLLIAAGHHY
ncbi:hypothetical protein [Arthrobacter sp. NPDC058127]